jgi:hypothetical protein
MEVNSSLCSLCQSAISMIEHGVYYTHHADAKCLYESAESGCHLCVFVWDAFRSSKRFSEFIPASNIPENNLEFLFIRFVLRHDTDLHLMMYHFELALKSPVTILTPSAKKGIFQEQILSSFPFQMTQVSSNFFLNLHDVNQINPRVPSSPPGFKQHGHCNIMENCKELARIMC